MDFNVFIFIIMFIEFKIIVLDSFVIEIDILFKENCIYYILVFDEKCKVVGIVGKLDFLYLLWGYIFYEMDCFCEIVKLWAFKVMEIMQEEVEMLWESDFIKEVVCFLLENCYQAFFVFDGKDSICGIVIMYDIFDLVNKVGQEF